MLLGLDEVSLEGESWLVSIPDAVEARKLVRESSDVEEAWVVSSDQVAVENLVAGIRQDRPDLPLYLIGLDAESADEGRIAALGVTGTWDVNEFCCRFDIESRRRAMMREIASLSIGEADPSAPLDAAVPSGSAVTASGVRTDLVADVVDDGQGACAMRDRDCFAISVFSGSGGVGKSSFVALAASLAQSRGFRVAIVDADTQFGDVSHMVSGGPRIYMDSLLDEPSLLDGLRASGDVSSPVVIEAPRRVELSEALAGRVSEVVSLCSKHFDVLFVDTGASWTDDHVWLLENGDCSLFMLDQRVSSVRSAQRAVDLCVRMGIATGSFVFALNRCSKDSVFSGMDVAAVMQGANVVELKDGESEVEEYLGEGLAAELAALRNDYVASIDSVVSDLLPSSSFFSKSPEWNLPPEEGRGRHRHREQRLPFFLERRERNRRSKGKRASRSTHSLPDSVVAADGRSPAMTTEAMWS